MRDIGKIRGSYIRGDQRRRQQAPQEQKKEFDEIIEDDLDKDSDGQSAPFINPPFDLSLIKIIDV